jgi:2-keto-3-deoxy-L-rhamnonate aldolase RhmA
VDRTADKDGNDGSERAQAALERGQGGSQWLAGDPLRLRSRPKCGWDSITVDLQHGVQDYLSMVACFQAMQAHPVTRLVRVPWNEPGIIGRVLDGGAYGVICPMVNTKEQCEALVSACR